MATDFEYLFIKGVGVRGAVAPGDGGVGGDNTATLGGAALDGGDGGGGGSTAALSGGGGGGAGGGRVGGDGTAAPDGISARYIWILNLH